MVSHSVEETERFGAHLARLLRPGDTLWLYGGLGAGKTALVRGLARGLGILDNVTSPTYTIAKEYDGNIPLRHYDAYRLSGWDELLGAGWDDRNGCVCAVEWAERMGRGVCGICVMLDVAGENERTIDLCFWP